MHSPHAQNGHCAERAPPSMHNPHVQNAPCARDAQPRVALCALRNEAVLVSVE